MVRDHSAADQAAVDEDWLRVLDQYSVQISVLGLHADRDLLMLLRSEAGWEVDFEDAQVVLFVREDGS
jgi:hypothetical protein